MMLVRIGVIYAEKAVDLGLLKDAIAAHWTSNSTSNTSITFAGAGFVVLQTVGLVPLMLNAVTGDRPRPSDKEDSTRL